MQIQQALHMMAGRTDLVCVRPEGEVLILTRNCSIKSLTRSGRAVQYQPTFGALLADTWQVMPIEKFREQNADVAA